MRFVEARNEIGDISKVVRCFLCDLEVENFVLTLKATIPANLYVNLISRDVIN